MEALRTLIFEGRDVFLSVFGRFAAFDFALLTVCFLVWILVYFLACLMRNVRFFIPQFFKLIAFCIFVSIPFVINYVQKNIFYPVQVEYKYAQQMQYSPVFFADVEVQNIGKRTIKQCEFAIDILRPKGKKINELLNMIKPLKTFTYSFKKEIRVGQSGNFEHTFQSFNYKNYQKRLTCFGH
ncbi:hypothetical protein BBW65_07550 [Helicobacter enhydrae]|uniref:DUF2393 domain-containing protein n=1 Tax=Helicobacter enhydrae TaxID=222136 RepID=A0A1B1U7E0_9HELI|nr:DUF2393 family protein [Helicobacter enhydrae]ANV98660.1 hypothetical protein BBW65_07550 [Helicobacter enhydrae]